MGSLPRSVVQGEEEEILVILILALRPLIDKGASLCRMLVQPSENAAFSRHFAE